MFRLVPSLSYTAYMKDLYWSGSNPRRDKYFCQKQEQITSQHRNVEIQRRQDKANQSQSENGSNYNQQQKDLFSGGYHRGVQSNSRGNGRVIYRNC